MKVVDFLAELLGSDAEVVLQDLTNLEKSIVAIRNGHISGRSLGGPATDLILKILKNNKENDKDYLINYQGISQKGKILKSSTFFIRDNSKSTVGALCINIDCEKAFVAKKFIDQYLHFIDNNKKEEKIMISEKFSNSVEEMTLDSIRKIVLDFGILPERMSQEEKIDVVKKINNAGIFLLKGAVNHTADVMEVSEATIYRYLSKIKKEEK